MTLGTVDLIECKTGGLHKWVYLGKKRQAYRCEACTLLTNKVDLKGATDDA
jgi:hypothetical protein